MNTIPAELTATIGDITLTDGSAQIKALAHLKELLKPYDGYRVLRHFCGDRIPDAPKLLDDAVFFSFDIEWWSKEITAKMGGITEFGGTLFSGRDLFKLASADAKPDFEAILTATTTHHSRILDNCHMLNDGHMQSAEKHSLFAHTRFVTIEETKNLIVKWIDGHRTADGSKAPVILIGQSLYGDRKKLKEQRYKFELDVGALESVVYTINYNNNSIVEAGILTETLKRLISGQLKETGVDGILEGFKITRKWGHNTANDAMHTLVPAILIALYQEVCPSSMDDFPQDSSLNSKSLNMILDELSDKKLSEPGPA
ncbi:hypothetical protein N0V90_003563 [Kalmusia sp. IMI 367209]|nr:hypothetical protein N0V90_003563 [Kalmusia sp. IMI 367209]